MSRLVVKSDLVASAEIVVDMVRKHEDRWDEMVRDKGLAGLLKDQLSKWQDGSGNHYEREHRLSEMAAVFLYAFDHVRGD